jgi:hypothetical protein
LDLARQQGGAEVGRSHEELQTNLGRYGWTAAWYALTYWGHQVNGGFGEFTQIRRLGGATDHLDEFHAAMATAAGKLPRFQVERQEKRNGKDRHCNLDAPLGI